jgi:hypothetical protein
MVIMQEFKPIFTTKMAMLIIANYNGEKLSFRRNYALYLNNDFFC